MAVNYVLDGYNVWKQMPQILNMKIEDRDSFVDFLYHYSPQGNNRLVIVFDGYGTQSKNYPNIEIYFSKDISADEYIISLFSSRRKGYYRVVTNDRDLFYKLRNLGIEVLKVSEFLASTAKKMRLRKVKNVNEKPSLYSLQAQRLREELERIWIKRR